MPETYIGRFAPSPTGPMHFGTLVAAVGSYIDAKQNKGQWLVRMEDIDELRNAPGAADDILRTLEAYGFEWDGEVVYQTKRKELYRHVLNELQKQDLIYPCTCSRKSLRENTEQTDKQSQNIYPGFCRTKTFPLKEEHAIRLRIENIDIGFEDRRIGNYKQNLVKDCGDFIIKRRDGLFAYQLVVVIDDEDQGVTHVVRGVDLIDSTPRQIYLQQRLNYRTPEYMHLPLIMQDEHSKLSKQTGAKALDIKNRIDDLKEALKFLGYEPEQWLSIFV